VAFRALPQRDTDLQTFLALLDFCSARKGLLLLVHLLLYFYSCCFFSKCSEAFWKTPSVLSTELISAKLFLFFFRSKRDERAAIIAVDVCRPKAPVMSV
jgi:hypothetical protein